MNHITVEFRPQTKSVQDRYPLSLSGEAYVYFVNLKSVKSSLFVGILQYVLLCYIGPC